MAHLIPTLSAPNVNYVQIDSLVIMKIVKHVDSELYAGMSAVAGEACQGLLTGLVSIEEGRLEVTNCFPTARAEPVMDADDAMQPANQQYEELKQAEIIDMLRKFRNMNIDYELVGFYQAHRFSACFSQEMADSLFDYQSSVHDGVVLIYDPIKTRQGQLSISAYRLSQSSLELYLKGDWTPEGVKSSNITYENMFEELPVVIKNSHLVNVMIAELNLAEGKVQEKSATHLELGTKRSLEKSVRSLMGNLDELNKAVQAYSKYQSDKIRHDSNVSNLLQKRQLENEQRAVRGEPALSLEDIKRMKVTGENIAKLFLAESIADEKTKS